MNLVKIAEGLRDLLPLFVFVGGATAELYFSSDTFHEIRETDDVDCVIHIEALGEYYTLEEKLRKWGFQDDMSDNAPICRKIYQGTKVDFMPTDENILGFSNEWYESGILYAQNYTLTSGISIRIFTPTYFIATKIAAFLNESRKYHADFYASHDFEDIISVLDNCEEILQDIRKADEKVKTYLKNNFINFLKNNNLSYALSGILRDEENEERLISIMQEIANM